MIVLDTNLLIEYLNAVRGTIEWMDRMRMNGERFAISSVTVVEVLAYPKLSGSAIDKVEMWLAEFIIFDVDMAQARIAARLRRELRLTTTDSIIAATAVALSTPLATHDIKLKRIRDINVISP